MAVSLAPAPAPTGASTASRSSWLRKWGPWVALVLVALAALVVGARHHTSTTLDGETEHIAGLVRCPVCNGETAAQSQSPVSVQIRATIRQDLQKGMTQDQILAQIVQSYDAGILETPQARGIGLTVYVVPVVAVVVGGAAVVLLVRRWRKGATQQESEAAPPEQVPVHEPVTTAAGPAPDPAETAPDTAEPAAAPPDGDVAAGRSAPGRRRWILTGVGVALVAAGASWAVASSSSTRLAGQPITGSSAVLSPAQLQADLQAASADSSRGDDLSAVKEYQKILSVEPDQVDALTGEGWVLAQTQQPALLQQGLQLLQRAELAQPGYPPAHVYRGIALLSEGDYSASVPELQWYLAHDPDPQLAPKVEAALTQAEAKAKSQG